MASGLALVASALGKFLVFVFGFVLLLFLPLSLQRMIVVLLEFSPLFLQVPIFVLLGLGCLFSDRSLMQVVVLSLY